VAARRGSVILALPLERALYECVGTSRFGPVQLRQVVIQRFRAIEALTLTPGPRNVLLGPQNAGKSSVLEALDLLLHHGIGRPRPAPTEIDYFGRDPTEGFVIEAVIGALDEPMLAETNRFLEGWRAVGAQLVSEPEGEGIEPVVRVRVRGTPEFDLLHDFAKPEAEAARFGRPLRASLGWVFDGRQRDPARQLAFYQGGLLDRLFAADALDPAVGELRAALEAGATAVNDDGAVADVLGGLADDLRRLGLVDEGDSPEFEVGAVSQRELLQSLRLALPAQGVQIPLFRQGRGAQRLLLVSVLLRLATAGTATPIAGFEEPEEALEPLRQAQLAEMLIDLADGGGQIFVVTHSPEIARAFEIEDFILLQERAAGANAKQLRVELSAPTRQSYERWLDGAVVRGLFSRVPILVEGPGDRAALAVFWSALAKQNPPEGEQAVRPATQLGADFVNCEGFKNMAMLAAVLDEAGKSVVAWAEQDQPDVRQEAERLQNEHHCGAIVLHEEAEERQNLEQAITAGASVEALAAALIALAADRGYSWEEQRNVLLGHLGGLEVEDVPREAAGQAETVPALLACLEEADARRLVTAALSAKQVTPFEMKGGRQARIVAEAIVEHEGVPPNFARAIRALVGWIEGGCAGGAEIRMADDGAQA
jgi:putative ATP-dependent endonuclease of the OLD family